MKYVYLVLSLLLFSDLYAQRCGTDEYLNAARHRYAENTVMRSMHTDGRDTLRDEVIVIPVVVHVLYNNTRQNISDEQIHAQLAALNRDFRRKNADTVNTPEVFRGVAADTRITFCLAKVDPNGYKTTGIVRKHTRESLFLADDQMKFSSRGGADAWDASRYLNIWVCDLFGRVLGYSTAPGANPAVDGIVIQYTVFGYENNVSAPYNKGRTLTHEVGHWLGLKHLWGDLEDGRCASDGVDDTPPQTGPSSGCAAFPKMSSCSVDSYGDMFMNYMDFSDDACMNLFTHGQKQLMRSQFARGGYRNSLLSSTVCDGSGAQEAPPVEKESGIRVYPNPVVDVLRIEATSATITNRESVSIFNSRGALVLKKIITKKTESIPMHQYPNGMYIVVVGDGADRKTLRVIKQSASGLK